HAPPRLCVRLGRNAGVCSGIGRARLRPSRLRAPGQHAVGQPSRLSGTGETPVPPEVCPPALRAGGQNCGGKFITCVLPASYKLAATILSASSKSVRKK